MFASIIRRKWTRWWRQSKLIMYLVEKAVDTNRHMNISAYLLVKTVLFNLSKAPMCLDRNVFGE